MSLDYFSFLFVLPTWRKYPKTKWRNWPQCQSS